MKPKDINFPVIAIDARILYTHPYRGSSRHLISLISCLSKENTVLLSHESIDMEKFGLDGYQNKVFGYKNYVLWEQISLPIWLSKYKNHVSYVLSPNHTSPIFSAAKRIIIIHDLIYLKHLFLYSPLKKDFFGFLYRTITTLISVGKKSKIITVSNYTKTQIGKLFSLNENSISVIGNPYFKSKRLDNFAVSRTRVLMVTGIMKHKNFENGVRGFFKSGISKKYKLTIVGINPRLISNVGEYHHFIDWRSNISDEELSILYSETSILLFPSTIEGFGIPLLEAMEFQVKICCSGNSVFPEICGDTATYFDPHSPSDIASALDKCDSKLCPNIDYKKILDGFSKSSIELQTNVFMSNL